MKQITLKVFQYEGSAIQGSINYLNELYEDEEPISDIRVIKDDKVFARPLTLSLDSSEYDPIGRIIDFDGSDINNVMATIRMNDGISISDYSDRTPAFAGMKDTETGEVTLTLVALVFQSESNIPTVGEQLKDKVTA